MTELTRMLLGPVALIFCGQLGREELDGVGLAISVSKEPFAIFQRA